MKDFSAKEEIQSHFTHEIDRTKSELRQSAGWLLRSMERLVERIDEDENPLVNSLGEVQGAGTEVDGLCRKYMALRDMQSQVNSIFTLEEREGTS